MSFSLLCSTDCSGSSRAVIAVGSPPRCRRTITSFARSAEVAGGGAVIYVRVKQW